MEVSSVPTKDGSIAEWDYDSIITKLRDTECSLLLERFFDSNTLLHVAASMGHDQIVEAILSKQQCQQELLTATNSTGDLPLHVAAEAGHLSIVQHLVESHLCQELLMIKNSNGDLPLHVAANAGHLSIVQHLVESSDSSHQCQQELLTAKNSSGDHPLHVAANAGHLYIVEHLLNSSHQAQNSKVNVASKLLTGKNNEGNTPLHLVLIKKYEEEDKNLKSKYNEVAKLLIETDPIVFNYRNKAQKNPYGMAIEAEDKELLELMKHKFASSPKPSPDSGDAKMKIDAEEREPSISKRVPQKSSMDPNLYKAVKSTKDIDFIKARDTEQSALSDKTPELNTILHLAAASSDDDHQFVQATLEIQCCQKFVTEKNSNGDLPLHVAASAGNMQIVELLVKLSNEKLKDHCDCVPLVEKNMEDNTPLHLALIKKFQVGCNSALKAKYNEVAKFLVEKCPEVSFYPNKERKSPLYLAVEGGDEELVEHMITTNRLPHGKSIVHAAIYYLMTSTNLPYGKSIVQAAIYGSFIARKKGYLGVNIYGRCTKKKKDILSTVLTKLPHLIKEQVDTKMTPLSYASSIGYCDGVRYLFEKSPDCAYQSDQDGFFPIHIASMKGHVEVIEFFLKEYRDMSELLDRKGRNILHVAAMSGKAKMVDSMLKRNDLEMLINGKDKKGNTPLHLASKKRHPMVVSKLTWDKRVNLSSLNILNMTAYDIAFEFEDIFSFREQLTWLALRYAGARRAPPSVRRKKPQSSKLRKSDVLNEYKDWANTLVVVATLVITVTFAAAFTMPGGYNGSGGVATFLEKGMFHLFAICNSIAMYSAITVVVALIWAQQRDLGLFISANEFAVPMLGLTLTMVSMAFMASNYLVLRNLHWLAYLVLIIGSFFILALSILFIPLCLPSSPQNLIARYIIYFPFYLLVKASRSDADDRKEE